MPHVSRYQLSVKEQKEILENLNLIFSSITKGAEMLSFLHSLLTSTEKVMLGKRMGIIILIEEGFKDSEIAKLLHVTEPTVAKLRLFYEARGEGFKIALKKLKEQKRIKEFKKLMLNMAGYFASPISTTRKTLYGKRFE